MVSFPILEIPSIHIKDYADLVAYGNFNTEKIAIETMRSAQIKIVNSTFNKLKIAEKFFSDFGQAFADKNRDLLISNRAEFIKKLEEAGLKSQERKKLKGIQSKFFEECGKLYSIDVFGDPSKPDKFFVKQVYEEFVQEAAARITGNSEISETIKSTKKTGQDRYQALLSANSFALLLIQLIAVGYEDGFASSKYYSHELPETLNVSTQIHGAPHFFSVCLNISSIEESNRLMEVLIKTPKQSIRSQLRSILDALSTDRPSVFYLKKCNEMAGFTHADFDTVLQSMSRYKSKATKLRKQD